MIHSDMWEKIATEVFLPIKVEVGSHPLVRAKGSMFLYRLLAVPVKQASTDCWITIEREWRYFDLEEER
jgi:hypothetical protein